MLRNMIVYGIMNVVQTAILLARIRFRFVMNHVSKVVRRTAQMEKYIRARQRDAKTINNVFVIIRQKSIQTPLHKLLLQR